MLGDGMDTLLWETDLETDLNESQANADSTIGIMRTRGQPIALRPDQTYQSLEKVMLGNENDPFSDYRALGFKNLAHYSELVRVPRNGNNEEATYAMEASGFMVRAQNLYEGLKAAGITPNGYDANTGKLASGSADKKRLDKERMDLAFDMMAFAMKVWSQYDGLDDLASAEDAHRNQYSQSIEFGSGSDMGSMVMATTAVNQEVENAYESPEFKLALAAYMAAKGLNSRLNGHAPGVGVEETEAFQYFATVAMRDPEYMKTVDMLSSRLVLGSDGFVKWSDQGPTEKLDASKMVYSNNW